MGFHKKSELVGSAGVTTSAFGLLFREGVVGSVPGAENLPISWHKLGITFCKRGIENICFNFESVIKEERKRRRSNVIKHYDWLFIYLIKKLHTNMRVLST